MMLHLAVIRLVVIRLVVMGIHRASSQPALGRMGEVVLGVVGRIGQGCGTLQIVIGQGSCQINQRFVECSRIRGQFFRPINSGEQAGHLADLSTISGQNLLVLTQPLGKPVQPSAIQQIDRCIHPVGLSRRGSHLLGRGFGYPHLGVVGEDVIGHVGFGGERLYTLQIVVGQASGEIDQHLLQGSSFGGQFLRPGNRREQTGYLSNLAAIAGQNFAFADQTGLQFVHTRGVEQINGHIDTVDIVIRGRVGRLVRRVKFGDCGFQAFDAGR